MKRAREREQQVLECRPSMAGARRQKEATAVGKRPYCRGVPDVDCSASASSKTLRKKRVRSSPSSLLGLASVFLGGLAWGGSRGVVRASWIDPDTLPEYHTKDFEGDGRHFDLVFSDEFDRCVRKRERVVCVLVCLGTSRESAYTAGCCCACGFFSTGR